MQNISQGKLYSLLFPLKLWFHYLDTSFSSSTGVKQAFFRGERDTKSFTRSGKLTLYLLLPGQKQPLSHRHWLKMVMNWKWCHPPYSNQSNFSGQGPYGCLTEISSAQENGDDMQELFSDFLLIFLSVVEMRSWIMLSTFSLRSENLGTQILLWSLGVKSLSIDSTPIESFQWRQWSKTGTFKCKF